MTRSRNPSSNMWTHTTQQQQQQNLVPANETKNTPHPRTRQQQP